MIKINLGSGVDYREGWINVDSSDDVKCEIKHDIRLSPLPFKDNEADYIYCGNVLEHLTFDELIKVMKELHRIIKKGGILHISVPYYNHPNSIDPFDHKTRFTFGSFDYFGKSAYGKESSKQWETIWEDGNPTLLGKFIPNFNVKTMKKIDYYGNKLKWTLTFRQCVSYVIGYVYKSIEYKLNPIK